MGIVRLLKARIVGLIILLLAIAVGANLVIFTVVDALWLKSDAIIAPDRVVMITDGFAKDGPEEGTYLTELGMQVKLRQRHEFESVAAQVATSGDNWYFRPRVTVGQFGAEAETLAVTWQYFEVMGLSHTIRGRDFVPDDDTTEAPLVGIISDRMWHQGFGGSARTIGSIIPTPVGPLKLIGIAPGLFEGARLGERTDLWVPRFAVLRLAPIGSLKIPSFEPPLLALARLKPGVSIEQIQSLGRDVRSQSAPLHSTAVVTPIEKVYGTPSASTRIINRSALIWIALSAACLVLIAGCVTVMGLLAVSYEGRRHEFAVRYALGCSPSGLLRSLLFELCVLGLGSAGAGIALSGIGFRLLPSLKLPGSIDLARFDLTPSWRMAAFGVGCSLIALVLGACLPLRRVLSSSVATELTTASPGSGAASLRWRRDVVALQVAVTMIAVVGAGPFVKTIVQGSYIEAGFDTRRTLFVDAAINLPIESKVNSAAERIASSVRVDQVLSSLRALPGVNAVSLGESPIGPNQAAAASGNRVFVTGETAKSIPALVMEVGRDFFKSLVIAVSTGRAFTDEDAEHAGPERPVVVTRSFARALWSQGSVIGQSFGGVNSKDAYRVVGITDDIAVGSVRLNLHSAIFLPVSPKTYVSSFRPNLRFIVNSNDPASLLHRVHELTMTSVPELFNYDASTGRQVMDRDLGGDQAGGWFFAGFGVIALTLGAAGVLGLVAFTARFREREMGVRLALGAFPNHLAYSLAGSSLLPVAVGIAAGGGVSAALSRAAAASFAAVSLPDTVNYVVAASVMAVTAALASIVGSWRIKRVSPVDVLRSN